MTRAENITARRAKRDGKPSDRETLTGLAAWLPDTPQEYGSRTADTVVDGTLPSEDE